MVWNRKAKHRALAMSLAGVAVCAANTMPARGARQSMGSMTMSQADATPAVALQPLAQQVRRIESTLDYRGQPLPASTKNAIDAAISMSDDAAAEKALEKTLEPYALAIVDINAESRVMVERGPATAALIQGGSRFFLVKVINRGGVTSPLNASSPNSAPVFTQSNFERAPATIITQSEVRDRWATIEVDHDPPLAKHLSGLGVEYQVLEVYSRDAGERSADISFDVGQGTQDIGFRNDIVILFHAAAAHTIKLHVLDDDGTPTMAALTIRDPLGRLYPNPSKRLAPDFFFQPQVYRADGETIELPAGHYTITSSGGPEYVAQTQEVTMTAEGPRDLIFQLKRWIDPSKSGWYSGDTHVHAAGCSHYNNPSEGVAPPDMIRQIEGEKLNIGSVLTWGPDYYYQKQFFSGHDDPLSSKQSRMHYDLEVSGFPSSFNGHLVLLGLKEQDYPYTKKIEDWPTWDLPILRWAKAQGAVVGFAHSGWGLAVADQAVPSFAMPAFDGIGANEYIVDVTEPNAVDFLSVGDTPYVWELSIWYHALNEGFRTRIAGETDFPCITDARVGQGRSYVHLDGPLTYAAWIQGLKEGRSYVSTGRAHLMNFKINGVEVGTQESEVALAAAGTLHASVRAAALLDELPDTEVAALPYDQKPYWSVERARIGKTRQVSVELVVDGKAVARKTIVADGQINNVTFDVPIEKSIWVAMRILPAAHTNPMFVRVADKPMRPLRADAEWSLTAVHQCWTQKQARIAPAEKAAAQAAYEHAEEVYKGLVGESAKP